MNVLGYALYSCAIHDWDLLIENINEVYIGDDHVGTAATKSLNQYGYCPL